MINEKNTTVNIKTASYIGNPISNTVMFIAKKLEYLLYNLYSVENCMIFYEKSIVIPNELTQKHTFVASSNPQLEYSIFVNNLYREIEKRNSKRKYTLTEKGYYIGENVIIGSNAIIEPSCLIDHDVVIGNNARIYSGTKIRNSIIGDNFIANENSVIGSNGFTMAYNENGNRIRIPTLGKVLIGNNVEVGTLSNISAGTAGNTIVNDFVKIDALVYVGHDAKLEKNVELPAGVIIGGYTIIEQNAFIGFNSTIRNRITIENNSIIGMGSVVTKDVSAATIVVGNPAKPLEKKS